MRAIVYGSIAVLATLAFSACSDSKRPATASQSAFNPFVVDASSAAPVPPTPPGSLAVGDCFNTDQFEPGSSIDPAGVHAISCEEPHQHQVYAIEHDPDPPGAPFPGDALMSEYADDVCLHDFAAAIGSDYRTSTLDFASIRPTATTWATGERAVICAAHDVDFAELTGSHLASTTTSTSASTSAASLPAESG